MARLESIKRLVRRWLWSIFFFAVLGLVLGALISIPLISRPNIAIITISGSISTQAHTHDILDMLRYARNDDSIKAVVLRIDSPGGKASTIEQVYLDVLRLRGQKPVVASIGRRGASGGYHIAVASNFIYAQSASQVGSVGAWVSLPDPEELDEDILTTGLFKAPGRSRRKAVARLEMIRQQFVSAVMSQRGDRLKISEEELTLAEIYPGVESLRHGLIDDIGTSSAAIKKAASLARIRNYEVVKLFMQNRDTSPLDMESLKSQTGLMPIYYYLYFESE
ncbi:MAG: S49 family peptidase [Chloroflexi bacterium]|nr:S49 family peptidase [Chloroflexota bacterium]